MAARPRVLLLHPDATALTAARSLWEKAGAEVHVATRPRHAFLALRQRHFDLVLAAEEAAEAGLAAFFLEARRLNPRIGRCARWEEAPVVPLVPLVTA